MLLKFLNKSDVQTGSKQVLFLQVRVDLGVIGLKGYSTLLKSPKLEPDYQMQFSIIPRTDFLDAYYTSAGYTGDTF